MSEPVKPTCPFCGAELRYTSPQANWFDCGSKVNKSMPDQYSQSFLCAQAERDRMAKELAEAKERNAELQKHLDETATKLLHAVNDRNSLGNQIDLLRDEFMRIRARIAETGLAAEHCELRAIADYCDRAQQDIAVRYSVIEHRDQLERKSTRLLIELSDANERIRRLEEAGDKMFPWAERVGQEFWTKAKETSS